MDESRKFNKEGGPNKEHFRYSDNYPTLFYRMVTLGSGTALTYFYMFSYDIGAGGILRSNLTY